MAGDHEEGGRHQRVHVAMVHKPCSPEFYCCRNCLKMMSYFKKKNTSKVSVIKSVHCPSAGFGFFFSLLAFFFLEKADRFWLERKACSKDEKVSCSKVPQSDGKSMLTLVKIGTVEWE